MTFLGDFFSVTKFSQSLNLPVNATFLPSKKHGFMGLSLALEQKVDMFAEVWRDRRVPS